MGNLLHFIPRASTSLEIAPDLQRLWSAATRRRFPILVRLLSRCL